MFKFCKKKPITLNFYTAHKSVYEEAQAVSGIKATPKWWRSLPNTAFNQEAGHAQSTIKRCVAVSDFYARCIVIPLPCDLAAEIGPIGSGMYRWASANVSTRIVVHPEFQRGAFLPDANYQHFKIEMPWSVTCDEDVEFAMTQPTMNFESPNTFLIPPAVVNFKYQTGVNVNMFIPRTLDMQRLTLEAGQPMLALIPLSDREVSVKHHLVSQKELEAVERNTVTFMGMYKRHKSRKNGMTCPITGA